MSKTIFITGSTDGIGKLAAIKFAQYGNEVFLHGRNPEKLRSVIKEVKELSGNNNIDGFLADFSDLASVKKMTGEIKERLSKCDILINNAGIFTSKNNIDKTGLDIRITVNYLAPYLIVNDLIPILKKGIHPRIINLGSAAQSSIDLASLSINRQLDDQMAYAQSKLAITMWTFHLAEKHRDITSIVVNPGSLLDTKMAKEAYGQVWSSATKGSDILYDLATASQYQNHSGEYFDNDKGVFNRAHADAYNQKIVSNLIEETGRALQIED